MEENELQLPPQKKYLRMTRYAVSLALMLAIGFIGGLSVNAAPISKAISINSILGDGLNATPDQNASLIDFWKAWNTLNNKFVQTHASTTIPTTEEKLWGAIEGLASSYGDPYTVFMPPEQAKVFQEDIRGNFEGVGMEIGIKDGQLTVIAPLKGTPAEQAGIRAGDAIRAIDGTSTEGMSTDAAVKLIRGEKGTTVTLIMLREGKILTIEVVRDTIDVPTINTVFDKENDVFTISLYSFTATSGKLFDNALAEFRSSGSHRLLIDLRGNPGGYLDQAVALASHFLPQGATVVTEDYKGKRQNIVHRSLGTGGIPSGTRVAILIDQGSASASEILSGALQDNDIATLIGTRSFGKGSVQEVVTIDGGALKVTVARWLTPADRSISDGGLTPDIEVNRTADDYAANKDPQMERAIKFLITGR